MPVEAPTAEGVRVTLIMQVRPAPNVVPQVFVCANVPLAPGFAVVTMLVKVSGAFPVLFSVTADGEPMTPTKSGPNATVDTFSDATAWAETFNCAVIECTSAPLVPVIVNV